MAIEVLSKLLNISEEDVWTLIEGLEESDKELAKGYVEYVDDIGFEDIIGLKMMIFGRNGNKNITTRDVEYAKELGVDLEEREITNIDVVRAIYGDELANSLKV